MCSEWKLPTGRKIKYAPDIETLKFIKIYVNVTLDQISGTYSVIFNALFFIKSIQ
jgi:hypothetical protein